MRTLDKHTKDCRQEEGELIYSTTLTEEGYINWSEPVA
jgi:hypothetical protein